MTLTWNPFDLSQSAEVLLEKIKACLGKASQWPVMHSASGPAQ
jgi:hypothetical protein